MSAMLKSRPREVVERTEARINGLMASLASRSPVARERARAALVGIGKPAVPLLVPLLSDRVAHVRWEAAKALCDIADPTAACALAEALEDREPDVRWVAGAALIALGRHGLETVLATLLRRAKSPTFREGARHVCRALAWRRRLRPILLPVLGALRTSEPELVVPLAAYRALLKLYDLDS